MSIHFIRLPLVCNFNCIFCFLEKRRPQDLDISEYYDKIYRASNKKIERIIFGGGEPTLIKELPDLIYCAKSIGIKHIELQTNGILFSYEDVVQNYKKAGLDRVLFAFHSHKEEIFNKLTRTKGNFKNIIKGVYNLLKNNIEVNFNCTINKLNFMDLPEYVSYIKTNFNGIKGLFFTFIYPVGEALRNKNILLFRIKDMVPYLIDALKFCKSKDIKVSIPHCGMPGIPLCLLRDISKSFKLEKLISSDKRVLKKTKEFNCINVKMKECVLCKYNQLCVGIAKNYIDLYGKEEFIHV